MDEMIELNIITTTDDRYTALSGRLAPLPHVRIWKTYADALRGSGGLDVTFVSLMSAAEWGVIELSPPLHRTRVVAVPDSEASGNRPRYAIPGVAIRPDEQLSPLAATQLILRESFRAITAFNETSSTKLKQVAAADLSLGLDRLKAGEILEAFESVYMPVPAQSLHKPAILRTNHP